MATAAVERYYESYLKFGFDKTLSNNRDIVSDDDEKLIRRFIDDRIALKGIGLPRQTQLGAILVYWKRYIEKPYSQLKTEDIIKGIGIFRGARKENGEPYKQNHINNMIIILKSFVTWLDDEGVIKINLKKIRSIKPPGVDTETNKADDLFTPEEINRMIAACHNSRDRAYIATIYETAARPGEMARLRWGDLTLNKESIKAIITDKKTRKKRTAFIIAGKSYLTQYLNDRGNVKPDDLVFLANGNKPLAPSNAYKIIYNAKNEAGITKHVQLKLFRKSRISNMLKEGYNDGAVREQAWGNQATQMFKVYAKYNDRDVEKAMLERAGIDIDVPRPEAQTKPRKCHVCGRSNAPTAKWCDECRTPLTDEAKAMQKQDEAAAMALLQNPIYLEKKLEELEALKKQVEKLSRAGAR